MAKFCQNCGTALSEGIKFCPSCGSPVALPVQPVQVPPQPQPQPQQQPQQPVYQQPPQTARPTQTTPQSPERTAYSRPVPQVYIPEQFAQKNAARAQQSAAPVKKKKGKGGLAAVSLLLVAAIVVGIFGFRDGGWFRGKQKNPSLDFGKIVATEEGSVSAESPIITLCGVTVDVDTLMLKSGKRDISVSVYESGTDDDGARYEAYELNMGVHEDFYVPVALTFPCRVDSDTDVVVEHYADNEWVPAFSFVNEKKGTVTAYFGSFSPARVSYRPVGKNPSLYKVVVDDANPYMMTLAVVSNYLNILQRTNPSEYADEVTLAKAMENRVEL